MERIRKRLTLGHQKIQNGIDTGESFTVSTRKDDGLSVMRFYTPIDAAGQTWWAARAGNQEKDLQYNQDGERGQSS